MNPRNLLITLSLIILALLIWQLRWVLLVLFGAVVLAVALDVPLQHLIVRWKIPRPLALLIVLLMVVLAGLLVVQVLLPQLITQFEQLTTLLPSLFATFRTLLANQPLFTDLESNLPEQFSWERIQPVGFQLLGAAAIALEPLRPQPFSVAQKRNCR